jgi:hypothetical protein
LGGSFEILYTQYTQCFARTRICTYRTSSLSSHSSQVLRIQLLSRIAQAPILGGWEDSVLNRDDISISSRGLRRRGGAQRHRAFQLMNWTIVCSRNPRRSRVFPISCSASYSSARFPSPAFVAALDSRPTLILAEGKSISEAWTIAKAIEEIAPKVLLERLAAACALAKPARRWISRTVYEHGEPVTRTNPDFARYRRAKSDHAHTKYSIETHLREHLKSGTLTARGRKGSVLAEPALIPASAWSVLQFSDWAKSIVKQGTELTIYDVRISQRKASELRTKSLARDRTACKAWLERHILSAPQKPFAPKAEFRSVAFDDVWDEVTKRAPVWRKQGRLRSDARRPVPSPR